MGRRLTKEEFVAKAIKVHGSKFSYDKVNYVNCATKVIITCPIHGDFKQSPCVHLKGCGCQKCGIENIQNGIINRKEVLVYGVGVNDIRERASTLNKAYKKWVSMLCRCYDSKYVAANKTYTECEVCDEWKYFSNFKKWFDENYIEGYSLDKDILIKGNKIYSPDTCCFVPNEINSLLCKSDKKRGETQSALVLLKETMATNMVHILAES